MFFLYNIISFLLLPVLLPLLLVAFGCRRKYRHRLPARLGRGLGRIRRSGRPGPPTLWVHALSVGEVTSAVPLLRALRARYPEARLLFSVTTATGRMVADRQLKGIADAVFDGPVDFLPVVNRFLDNLEPDLYILVETDFWPNLLHCLRRRKIPALLVNGRISAGSMRRYRRGRAFFLPMFHCFTKMAMQTVADRDGMLALGVAARRLPILGNLKFAGQPPASDSPLAALLPGGRRVLVAGSTHDGEEGAIIDGYQRLRQIYGDLYLVIVPRDPQRAAAIASMATIAGLAPRLRSTLPDGDHKDLLIVDTIGELLGFYALAALAFVGGSLVAKGGHNPVEPAGCGVPVLFGPHMEDFSEIAALLLEAGAATRVGDANDLVEAVTTLLDDPSLLAAMGSRAREVVLAHNDVVDRHLQLIDTLL